MADLPQIERYEIRSVLGRGGFAMVYRAFDRRLRRVVALKLLHAHLAAEPELCARFVLEAERLAQLRHPNIVTVYDVDAVEGIPYFTMELLEGRTLSQLVSLGHGLELAQVV